MYNEPRIHFVLFWTLLQAIYYYQKQKHKYMTGDKATSGMWVTKSHIWGSYIELLHVQAIIPIDAGIWLLHFVFLV